MNKKENQRMRLTRLLFRNSLISLLQQKSIYQISVTEICSVAELNRSTFYKHYDTVYDILVELEKETLEKSTQCMQEIEVSGIDQNMHPIYQLLCYIQENKEIYQLLLNNSVNEDFPASIMKSSVDFLRNKANDLHLDDNPVSDYLFRYLVSGCISVIQDWINGDMAESPLDIAKLIYSTSVAVLESQKTNK